MSDPMIEGATVENKSPALGLLDQTSGDRNPQVDVDPGRKVTTRIVREASESECEFWFGLTKAGPHSPLQLLRESSTDDLLKKAAVDGINEDGPIVLFDSEREYPRGLLLMPVPDDSTLALNEWLETMLSTLIPWSPARLGLYLAPEAVGSDPQMNLLLAVLRRVLHGVGVREVFLLTGSHGTNLLLNAALRLKLEVSTEEFEFYVYH